MQRTTGSDVRIEAGSAEKIAKDGKWDKVLIFTIKPGEACAYQSHGFDYGDAEIFKLLRETLYTNG